MLVKKCYNKGWFWRTCKWLKTAEKNVRELEQRPVKIIQTETKKMWRKQNKVPKNCGKTFLWFNLCVIGNPGGKEGENEKKNILRDSGWEFFLK